jgi:endonuclease III
VVLLENAAYLVDDARRAQVFAALKRAVGTDPDAILNAPPSLLASIIQRGGMRPAMRADKLRRAATIAREVGGRAAILRVMRDSPEGSRQLLKRFPGIGDPGADKLLLLARLKRTLAPDSNILRVLRRLGFGGHEANYGREYRSVEAAVEPQLPSDFGWLIKAHALLRQHGQEICRRSEPDCPKCPLTSGCAWFRRHKMR